MNRNPYFSISSIAMSASIHDFLLIKFSWTPEFIVAISIFWHITLIPLQNFYSSIFFLICILYNINTVHFNSVSFVHFSFILLGGQSSNTFSYRTHSFSSWSYSILAAASFTKEHFIGSPVNILIYSWSSKWPNHFLWTLILFPSIKSWCKAE